MDMILLKQKIKNRGYKLGEFACLLSISRSALYRKMNGYTEFKLAEIQLAKELLKLTDEETINIFL